MKLSGVSIFVWEHAQKLKVKSRTCILFYFLFIVLFAISCTKQKKSNYLNSHGEEAQEKPPGL